MDSTKKDILIIMNNLRVGGAEKALISLLQTFDYSTYNVDLLLFKREGLFLNQVPKEVTLLEEPPEYKFFDMAFSKAILKAIQLGRFDILVNRIRMAYLFKTEKNSSIREQKLWNFLGKCLQSITKKYDLSIGYLEKTPNYFCADKVNAKVKIGFMHNDYLQLDMSSKLDLDCFSKLDYIATVSQECKSTLEKVFPNYARKFIIVENIISPAVILKLAEEKIEELYDGFKLITLGRLVPQKGYDLLIEAAAILYKKNIDFRWYILGIGELQTELETLIKGNKLDKNIIFLGLKENPYPYIKKCDIYVQTSRFEGFGIAVAEAKILNKTILLTNFNTASSHITDEINGLITDMNATAIATGLERLINNATLRQKLSDTLSLEIYDNSTEIEKIYALIN